MHKILWQIDIISVSFIVSSLVERNLNLKKNTEMIVAVELKKWMTSTYIFGVVIYKFGYKQEPCFVILLQIDKNPEVGVYNAIFSLGLTICQ